MTDTKAENSCGECFACCIHLGIEELRRPAGQTCKHLDGSNPQKRCSIYATRPEGCQTYKCFYRSTTLLPEHLRPDRCGFVTTAYELEGGELAARIVIMLFDPQLGGSIQDLSSPLGEMLNIIFTSARIPVEVIILNTQNKKVLFFKDGQIFLGRTLPQTGYEDLKFAVADEKPLGTYRTQALTQTEAEPC